MPKAVICDNSNNPLQVLLKEFYQKDKGEFYTHTSIGYPKGVYKIPLSMMDDFYKVYEKVVFHDKIPTYLTEGIRDQRFTPLKIDIDFRYYDSTLKRRYKQEDIIEICKKYMLYLDEYLEEPDKDEREFFILEKPEPSYDVDKKGEKKQNAEGLYRIKDGVHILAPRIISNSKLQLIIRNKIYKDKDIIQMLDKYNFDNGYHDIFDLAVIENNNWQMYGSTKPGKPPYLVKKIVRVWSNKIENVALNKYNNGELIRLLSVRDKDEYSLLKTTKELEIFHDPNDRSSCRPHRMLSKSKKQKHIRKLKQSQLKLVIEYVDCLNVERSKSYREWLEVGWCLHNLHNKDNTLLNKWIEFSKKSDIHSSEAEDSCKEFWSNMCDEGLGIGSLKMWARQDNAPLYDTIVRRDINSHILRASKEKGSSYDIANVLYEMFKDRYVCVSAKDNLWFYYDQSLHRWIKDASGTMLRKRISTDLYQEFSKMGLEKQQQSLEADDQYAELGAKILKVAHSLKSTSSKNNIMSESKELFYDAENSQDKLFLEKLDANAGLLGCNNGVYDLLKEEFRDGRPEDYISINNGINYIPYDPYSQDIIDIHNFIKSIFVIKTVRKYVLRRAGSWLSGSTKDESFDVFSGVGGNGKSKFMELVEQALGKYSVKLPCTLLTGKRAASSSATPELARCKGVRLATLQEPDDGAKINVGIMKELTGGDTIQARALYSDCIDFKPQFKLVLCCNDKPELPSHDEGTWRRVRLTEYRSRFVYEPDLNKPLQFKIDTDLSTKFEGWGEPMLSLLIHYHSEWKKLGLEIPDEILKYTDEYRATNNHFRDFVVEMIEDAPNKESFVTLDELYEVYREWYRENNSDNKCKKRKELRTYLDQKFGEHWRDGTRACNRGYRCIRIIRENLKTDKFKTKLGDDDRIINDTDDELDL
uniref:SF3 helicase domain-containing protein n=1 Tax=viral metagenome TaxID=1070528 RepID=A0A6C0JEY4_9ZZZZ